MYKSKLNVGRSAYKRLSGILAREFLSDFQEFIGGKYGLPTLLWFYDACNRLRPIKRRNNINSLPDFCDRFRSTTLNPMDIAQCQIMDENHIPEVINENIKDKEIGSYFIDTCHMGISRLIFPVKINGEIVAVLLVGKFVQNKDQANDVISKISDFFSKAKTNQLITNKINELEYYSHEQKLKQLAKEMPILGKNVISKVDADVQYFLPFIKNQFLRIRSIKTIASPALNSLTFLESQTELMTDTHLSYPILWQTVNKIFENIVNHLNLKSAKAFFTDQDDYQRLIVESGYPSKKISKNSSSENIFSMDSPSDLPWIAKKNRGTVLPINHGPLIWINDYIEGLFESRYGILYANEVYAQRWLMLGFGFTEGIYLTELERFILRDTVSEIFKFIHSVVFQNEMNEIMVQTGHQIGRTLAKINAGSSTLVNLKSYERIVPPEEIPEFTVTAENALRSGIFKLDLIVRNYHAFKDIAYLHGDLPLVDNTSLEENAFDFISLLREFIDIYSIELNKESKKIVYECRYDKLMISTDQTALKTIFWNIYDNAIKYSYKNYRIETLISVNDRFVNVEIKSHGVGVPKSQEDQMFEMYYKSRYRDPDKSISGHGIGLSTVKRYVNYLFPEGQVSLISTPTTKNVRFEGDHYDTAVTVSIPRSFFTVIEPNGEI